MRVIRTERGPHYSRGSQELAHALDARALTMTACADEVSKARQSPMSKSSVSGLLNGDRRPGLGVAITLRDLYGVPVESWHEAPAASESSPVLPSTGTDS